MPATGFPKRLRLTRAAEYRAVFSKAKYKVSCQYLLVIAITNNLPHARLGIIVAKKNVARAVHRNRIKRLIRTSFRLHQDLLAGLDIVILARSKPGSLENDVLNTKINVLWQDLVRKAAADITPQQDD